MSGKNGKPVSRPGATGRHPEGSMGPHDEGELAFGVATDAEGNVHFNFGTPVTWFAMPADQAIQLARLILQKAGAKKVEIEL